MLYNIGSDALAVFLSRRRLVELWCCALLPSMRLRGTCKLLMSSGLKLLLVNLLLVLSGPEEAKELYGVRKTPLKIW